MGVCPELSISQFNTCDYNCRSDADCESDLKCCQNGCSSLQCTMPNLGKNKIAITFFN